MGDLQKLYDVLTSQGLYTKSFDAFVQQYQNESYRDKVFNVVSSQGLYTKSKSDFDNKYRLDSDTPTIQEEVEVDASAVPEKKNPFETDDTGLPSGPLEGDISSESFLTESTVNTQDPFAATILGDRYNKDLSKNAFIASVNSIDAKLTGDREEEQVVPEMNYKFNQYGFTFEETGIGDKMKVKAANGKELSVPLDAFGLPFVDAFEIGAESRAKELKKFIIDNKEESQAEFDKATTRQKNTLNKIQNKEQLVSLNTLFNTEVDRFSEDVKNYSAEKLRLEKIYNDNFSGKTAEELELNPYYEQYKEAQDKLNSSKESLINRQNNFAKKGAQLDEMVGEYTLMQKQAGGAGQAFERLGNSLLEGVGGAFASMFEEIGAFVAPKLKNFDASESRFAAGEHIDYAVAQLINNEDNYQLDEVGILTSEDSETLKEISDILKNKELDVVKEKKLKSLFSQFNPQDLQVILENIETPDGDNLHSLTESIYEDTATKALREYEDTEILTTVKGRPDLMAREVITDYEKAKSAAMGGAFSRNRYTGGAGYLDIEEGTRDKFRTLFSKYIGQEDDAQEAYRKTIKNSGNDFQKAMHGVSYSIPAFVGIIKTGGKKAAELTAKYGPVLGKKLLKDRKNLSKASRVLRLMSQSNEAQMQKMANNPNFDNIDLDEQRAVAVPIAITTAILEDIGFRNIINQGGLVNSLASRAITKFAKAKKGSPNITSKTFGDFIRRDIDQILTGRKAALTKGGLVVLAGGAAEFETGALQSVGEITIDALYNNYKKYFDGVENKMFDTPESITAFAKEVMYQGYLEMLGGKIMAVPTAISAMANNSQDLDLVTDEAFEMFTGMLKDPQYKKMFVTNLKQRVADTNDSLTQEDADGLLETFNKIEGLAPKIPSDFTIKQQRQALNLLMEKQQLESAIEGKAPELVTIEQSRINEINEQLTEITTKAAAEQESAQEAEKSIPEFQPTKTEVEEDVSSMTQPEITEEERQDIDEMFGKEEGVESEERVEQNLFFNRKGKSEETLDNESRSMRNKVINKAVNAAKSISKNFNTKIVLHESSDEFNNATGRTGRGFYDFDANTIHIDMNKANEGTIAHEVFHAVLFQRLGEKNIAEAVNRLTTSAMKALDKNSLLYKKIDTFAKLYKEDGDTIQNEERLAELFGEMAGRYERLNAPAKNAVLDFIKRVGKALGIDVGDIVTSSDIEVVNFLNTLADKVQRGQEIFTDDLKVLSKSEPYSESGVPVTVNTESKPIKPEGRESRVYTSDRVGDYAVQTLNDFVTLHDGNIYVITSDATRLGKVEETGQILDGGFGYSLLDSNMKEGVGFASLDALTAERNMDKLKNNFEVGQKVGILIMIQTPDVMYGNMYGAEFFYDSISKMQKSNPQEYSSYSELLANYKNSKMGKGEMSSETKAAIVDPSSVTKQEFVELMKKENFDRRRNYMTGVIPSKASLKVGSATPSYKKAFLSQGITTEVFNLTYGDKSLLGENFLKENKGGYLVGGFTYVVPESTRDLVESVQDKGFTHPFFQGKVPAEPNSQVLLDGLYSVDKTIQAFMPDTLKVDLNKKEEINERVREQYKEDKAYEKNKIKEKPLEKRTYTDLKVENKIAFKQNKANRDLMVAGKANAVSLIAQSKPPLFKQITEEITEKPRGREQKEIVDIVTEARESNFRDEVIKDYLVRVKKYPAKIVNKIMEVDVDLFNTLPKSFGNLKGGFDSGLELFKRVKAFEQKLIRGNNRRRVKLTEQQIADKTIEFLEKQPEYKNEGDGTRNLTTRQAMLQVEFQKSVGTRPSQSVQQKLTEARRILQQRRRGAKDLQSVKVALRNFIRKSLPVDLYTRSEVMNLVNKITSAGSTAQVENLFDEVIEFVNKKNNARLEKKIKQILDGKYDTVVSGRKKGTKVSPEMRDRIESISNQRLTGEQTAENIENTNQSLTEEFNQINQKDVLTEADLNRMVDIQILLNLNNSLLMEDNDVNKTGALDIALSSLQEMVLQGRAELKQEIQEANEEYNRQASVAYEEITGQKVDLGDPDVSAEVDLSNEKLLNKKRAKTKGVIKGFLNNLKINIKKVFNEAEALDGLMDLISKLPGDMFGGRLQELVTNRIDASSRLYKQRMIQQEDILNQKLIDIYGKKWRDKVRDNNKPELAYVINPEEVAKAKDDFNNDPSLENKEKLKEALQSNEVEMSQNEMLYYYNLYKDPANKGSFKSTFGKDYARIMEEIESNMNEDVKEFGDWQVNEFYPSLYSHYNNTYRALYRTNMPWNRHYSGMIYRNDPNGNPVEEQPLDLLANNSIVNTSVGASSTKARTQNNLPIRKMNSMNVMATYLRDMEYFAAYGESIRDISKMFKNKSVRNAISAIHGEYINRLINNSITKIANQGIRTNAGDKFVNKMNNLFVFSRIGLNPTVMIKQLTSMVTYANDIGVRNWLKYSLKSLPEIRKTFKEISENSVYMQDRNKQSITRVIESYSNDGLVEMVPNKYWDNYVNFIMYTTKFGDKAAIYLGGMPNYLYYKDQAKKRGLSESQAIEEAILRFERDTKRTQQSMDLQDKDYYQTSGALQRGLNMFLTTPKQYLRKEIQSTRNLYRKISSWDKNAGKGSIKENIRTFLTYHVIAPVLFQYVSLGLPGLLRPVRDDDDDDLLRAAIIGNLNALFIIGEVISGTADLLQGKPYAGESVRSIAPLMQVQRIQKLAKRAMETKDRKKAEDAYKKLYVELVTSTGLPAVQIDKFIKNLDELGKDGDIGKDILRLLNFSNYVIEGQKKKKKKTKSIAEQNAEYEREQERKKRQSNNIGFSRGERPTERRNRIPKRKR